MLSGRKPFPEAHMAQATPFRWKSASRSNVGRVRDINEDACLDRPERGLWAVADGMGGHTQGDVASCMVISALDGMAAAPDLAAQAAQVRARLDSVNRQLLTEAAVREVQVIGSTVVVLLASGRRCICLWAGDSRIYRHRDGVLEQLSRDHSHVEELVMRGLLSRGDARHHPARNVITRAVGVAESLDLEEVELEVRHGDMFLLCSDGLSNEVSGQEMAAALAARDCRLAAVRLVEMALEHGGRDNVSVVVALACDPDCDDLTALNPALP
jgi:protein phosphatase